MLGDPSPGQLQSFAIFFEAQQAAEDLIKPGVTAPRAARAQNDVFRKYGYGEYTGSNTHACAAIASACFRMKRRTSLKTSIT